MHSVRLLHVLLQSTELSTLDEKLKKKFSPKDGPFYRSLDKSLSALNVQRQAYQGGTFIGNHVHKLLQVHSYMHTKILSHINFFQRIQSSSIKVLCQNMVTVAPNAELKAKAEVVSATFTRAFELFAKCHRGYNSNVVTNPVIEQTSK